MIGRIGQLWRLKLRACGVSTVAGAVVALSCMTSPAQAQSIPGPGGGWGGGFACPDVWDPVCGVDGNTYSNACYASLAGVAVAHHGPCSGDPGGPVPINGNGNGRGGGNGGGGPGGGGGGGYACPDVWDPVCGVDGNTYSNACYASLAGVAVAFQGACDGSGGGPVPIGGLSGARCICPVGYYCYTPPGECDAVPVCVSNTGYECLAVWDPVCGCDGNTHSNACYASLAGVSVAHAGECGGGGPSPIAGWIPGGGITVTWCLCPWGQYCYTPPGECDADPVCAPRPDACLDVWIPVCGCNNVTYSNACYAAMAGVGVQYHDACGGGTMMSTSPGRLPDLNGDGTVGIADLLIVIDSFGSCKGCAADITGTGEVDALDVLMVLTAWGMSTVE